MSVACVVALIVQRQQHDNDNDSNFIAMNCINHITRDIQARLIDGK